MSAPRALALLVRPATYRRGVHLLLGAVLLLTNATRHAAAQPVSVRVSTEGGTMTIESVNPVAGRTGSPSGRRGLDGMRERVSLFGGQMTAGPDGGQWRVVVRLPFAAPRRMRSAP